MLGDIKKFFDNFIQTPSGAGAPDAEHRLQLATADLLYVSHSDFIAAKQRARAAS